MKIAVSILNIKDDASKIKEVECSSADYIHLDIMDGQFVSNVTDMNRSYKKALDIHLMVYDVKNYIDTYKHLHPEYITFHYEAVDNPKEIIDYIHSLGSKAGISISPDTQVEEIVPYLESVDLVLVMSVVPGKGGQAFMTNSVHKINMLYDLREKNSYNYEIEVDGGINKDTLSLVTNVDIAVIGSYITMKSNYEAIINEIKEK